MDMGEEGRDSRKCNDWLREVFWSLPLGIAKLNKTMEFVEVNPAFEDILGRRSEDVKGKNFYDFIEQPIREMPPGNVRIGNAVVELWSIPLRSKAEGVAGYAVIARRATRDRRREEMVERYVQSLERELEAKSKEFYERIDETVLKRTKELRDIASSLEKSNKLKDLFIDILCHDLLNPIGIAKNYLELLMEDETDKGRLEELQAVERNLNKIISIIEDSSKYARLEATEKLALEKRDIGEIFKRVVENSKPMIEEKRIKLRFRPWRKYYSLVDDSIADVFDNLLSNAIKYSPEGGRVVIDILDNGNDWRVMVKDYGEGVPDKDKKAIFERFERKTKDGVKGSGLGLAIVKRAVELHKGRVWVEDNPDGGSIFYVSLPKAT
jgi:signal transduction histidine kinase